MRPLLSLPLLALGLAGRYGIATASPPPPPPPPPPAPPAAIYRGAQLPSSITTLPDRPAGPMPA